MRRRLGPAALIALLGVPHQAAAQGAPVDPEAFARRVIAAPPAERAGLLTRVDVASDAVASALNAAGDRARLAADCRTGLVAFAAAETVARQAYADPEIGRALNGRADCLFALTDLDRALDVARESVAFHARRDAPEGLAEAWNTIGNIHFYRSEHDAALEANARTRELWAASGHRLGVGRALNNAGNIYRARSQYDQAAAHYDESLAIFEALDDRRRAAVVLSNIAITHFRRGDYPTALSFAERSLAAAEALADRPATSKALDTLGNVHRAVGAYTRALDAFTRSRRLRTTIGDRYAIAESENNIGLVHFSRGDYVSAIAAYKRGLREATRAGTAEGLEAEALLNIGAAAWRLGQKDRARANVRASLALADRDRSTAATAAAANAMGQMAVAGGRWADAGSWYQRALAIHEAVADHAGTAEALIGLAHVRWAVGRADDALARASQAADLAGRYEQVELLWQAQTWRGMAQRRLGDAGAASASFRQAIDVVERLRREVGGRLLGRERFFESKLSPYHELMAVTLEGGDVAGALAVAERAKARGLADLVQDRRGPRETFTRADAATLVPTASTAVLAFVVTEQGATVFVLSRVDGRLVIEHRAIALRAPALAAHARRFRDRLAARDLAVAGEARRLYDLLIAPVAHRLAGVTHLVVVPDGPLWEVPFQALMDRDRRYVVETAAVSYAPSLTVLRETLRTRPERTGPPTLLAMGHALPEAEAQVEALRALYGARSRVYLGDAATERRFKSEAPGQRLIHIASHGVFDASSPRHSHLVLAPGGDDSGEDGVLEAWELADVALDADLVVLSACETGRGRVASGEGLVGTMWALLAAGARAAVVSQWMVEASSTTRVMTAFHERLARGGGTMAGHLRLATLDLLQDPRYRHPFYWAPFVLVGDPY